MLGRNYASTLGRTTRDYLENLLSLVDNVKGCQDELDEETYENTYFHIVDLVQKANVSKQELLKLIDEETQRQETFETDMKETKTHVENLKKTTERLERLLVKKDVEAKELEQSVAALKGQLQSIVKEKENLTKLRQEILTYKLLTRVDLVFSSTKVAGLIVKDVPKPFRFDPARMPKEEITKKIWDLILEK